MEVSRCISNEYDRRFQPLNCELSSSESGPLPPGDSSPRLPFVEEDELIAMLEIQTENLRRVDLIRLCLWGGT